MAEGFLKQFNPQWEIYSAGTKPAEKVNPYAIKVMNEIGIDISSNTPKMVDQFLDQEFDYVITVCDGAKETCPMFTGKVKHRLHIGFEDPAEAKGSEEFILNEFRRIRDEIKKEFQNFYPNLNH
jgi:arsenate reductase